MMTESLELFSFLFLSSMRLETKFSIKILRKRGPLNKYNLKRTFCRTYEYYIILFLVRSNFRLIRCQQSPEIPSRRRIWDKCFSDDILLFAK